MKIIKKKSILFISLFLIAFAALGINMASAHGWFMAGSRLDPAEAAERQTQMFENEADTLGISVDEVKNYWAEGKNLKEIADEIGLSQEDIQAKLKENRQKNMEDYFQALVQSGVITQDQADARLKVMEERDADGKFGGRRGMGFIGGFRHFHEK